MFQGRDKDTNSSSNSNSSSSTSSNSNSSSSASSSSDNDLRLPSGAKANGADRPMVFAMHAKELKKKLEEVAKQNKIKNSSSSSSNPNDDIVLFAGLGHPTTAVSLHACEGAYKTCEEIQQEASLIKGTSSLDDLNLRELSSIKVQEEISSTLTSIDQEFLTNLRQKIQQENEDDPRVAMARGLNRFYNPKKHNILINAAIRPEHLFYTVGGAGGLRHLSKIINEKGGCRILTNPHYALHADAHGEGEMVKIDVMKQRVVNGVIEDTGYRLKKEDLQATINSIKDQGKKINALILCNPNNPLGSVLNAEELKDLIEVASNEEFYLIFDEAYIEMDNAPNVNQFSFLEYILVQLSNNKIQESTYKDLRRRTIILRSGTKGIGAAAARMALIITFDKFIQNRLLEENQIIGMPARHLQVGYANAMDKMGSYFLDEELIFNRRFYDAQAQYFFERSKVLTIGMPDNKYKPESTFYVLFDLSKFRGMAVKDRDIIKQMYQINPGFLRRGVIETDEELAYYLLIKRRIMVAPLSYYGADPKQLWFRATCSLGIDLLQMLLDRLEIEMRLLLTTMPTESISSSNQSNHSSQMSDTSDPETTNSLSSLDDSTLSSLNSILSSLRNSPHDSPGGFGNESNPAILNLLRSKPTSNILSPNLQSPMEFTRSLQHSTGTTPTRSQSPSVGTSLSPLVGTGVLIDTTKTEPSKKGVLQQLLNSEIKHTKYNNQGMWAQQLHSVLANVTTPPLSPPELAKPAMQRTSSTPMPPFSTKLILNRSGSQSPTHSMSQSSDAPSSFSSQPANISSMNRSKSDFKYVVPKATSITRQVVLSSINRKVSTTHTPPTFVFTTPALLPTAGNTGLTGFSLTNTTSNLISPFEDYASLTADFWREAAKKATVVKKIREEYYQESYDKCFSICNDLLTPILGATINSSWVGSEGNKPKFQYVLADEIDLNNLKFAENLNLSQEETETLKLSLEKLYLNIVHNIQYIAYYIENVLLGSNIITEGKRESAIEELANIMKKQVQDELNEKERDEVLRKQDERLIEELNRRIINKLEEASSAYFLDALNSPLKGFVELIKTKIFFDSFNRVDNECSNLLQKLYVRRTKGNTKDDLIIKYIKRVVEANAALDYGHPQGDETYRKIIANALNHWYGRELQIKKDAKTAKIDSDHVLFVGCHPEPVLKEVFVEIVELDENNYQSVEKVEVINKIMLNTKFARAVLFKNSEEAFSRPLAELEIKEIADFFKHLLAKYQNLYLIIDESFVERCLDKNLSLGKHSLFNALPEFQDRVLLVRSGRAVFTSENISVIITPNKECGARLLEESIIIHGHAPRPQQYAYARALQNYCNKLQTYLHFTSVDDLERNQYLQETQRLIKYYYLKNLPTFGNKHLLQSLYGKVHKPEATIASGPTGAIYTILGELPNFHRSHSAIWHQDEEPIRNQIINDLQSLGHDEGSIRLRLYDRSISAPPEPHISRSDSERGTILLYDANTPASDSTNNAEKVTPYTPVAGHDVYQKRLLAALVSSSQAAGDNEEIDKEKEESEKIKESSHLSKRKKLDRADGLNMQHPQQGSSSLTFSYNNHTNNSSIYSNDDNLHVQHPQEGSNSLTFSYNNHSKNGNSSTIKLVAKGSKEEIHKRKASEGAGVNGTPTTIEESSNSGPSVTMTGDGKNSKNPAKKMMLTVYSEQRLQREREAHTIQVEDADGNIEMKIKQKFESPTN